MYSNKLIERTKMTMKQSPVKRFDNQYKNIFRAGFTATVLVFFTSGLVDAKSHDASVYKNTVNQTVSIVSKAENTLADLGRMIDGLQVKKSPDEQQKAALISKHELLSKYNELRALDDTLIKYYDLKVLEYKPHSAPAVASVKKLKQHYVASIKQLGIYVTELVSVTDSGTFSATAEKALSLIGSLQHVPNHTAWDQHGMPFGPGGVSVRAPLLTQAELLATLNISMEGDPSTPTTADLEETTDAAFTDDIRSLAGSLANDPVAIYNWVYNNITFIPSYGSIQGADMTLQIKRGNATDTASLLVALLRISGIPSRYAYGSIDLSIEQSMNWVGGVDKVASATNLLGQGGVPTILRRVDGEDDSIGIEHTWVQLWSGSSWVDVDPSFKQYEFMQGIDYAEQVPLDFDAFVATVSETMTEDAVEQSIQNLDPKILNAETDKYLAEVDAFTNALDPSTSVAEYLGGQYILETNETALPSLPLPYKQLHANVSFSEVPDSLKHKFKIEMKAQGGGQIFSHEIYTAELAGQFVSLSFEPASAADLADYLDFIPDGLTGIEQIPSQLPVGLFNVTPLLEIGDAKYSFNTPMRNGEEVIVEKGFRPPQSTWEMTHNPMIAGEYQAIGVSLQGESGKQFTDLQNKVDAVGLAMSQGNYEPLAQTGVFGLIQQSIILTYFSELHARAQLHGALFGVVVYPQPSYGTFTKSATVRYNFGLPESYEVGGFLMDIDRLNISSECKSNCWNKWYQFNQDIGALSSAYEHEIPERYLGSLPGHVYGVSTIKAIDVAMESGQKIFRIESDNWGVVRPLLQIDSAIIDEINAAVQSGAQVLTHESPVEVGAWTGAGYIIVDPDTGAAAYKISGGSNGGAAQVILEADFSDGSERCPYQRDVEFNAGPIGVNITINSQLNDELRDIFGIASEMLLAFFPNYDEEGKVIEIGDLKKVGEEAGKLSEAIHKFLYESDEAIHLPLVEYEYLLFAASGAQALNSVAKGMFERGLVGQAARRSPNVSLAFGMVIGVYIAPYLYSTLVHHCRL